MKRLKIFILLFSLALSIPLGYVVWSTYRSLEQEEKATFVYFGDVLFDEIENELAALVRKEETRAVDEYRYAYSDSLSSGNGNRIRSPLSYPPTEAYILGYFQNNPDGSFQTPLTQTVSPSDMDDARDIIAQLRKANELFNTKRSISTETAIGLPSIQAPQVRKEVSQAFTDNYLNIPKSVAPKARLGQETKRLERIPSKQFASVDRQHKAPPVVASADRMESVEEMEGNKASGGSASPSAGSWYKAQDSEDAYTPPSMESEQTAPPPASEETKESDEITLELDPMQAVFLDNDQIFIFRRIVANDRIYRQGFVLLTRPFLEHLVHTHFAGQPMARYAHLKLAVHHNGTDVVTVNRGPRSGNPKTFQQRWFPRPFSFLYAELTCGQIPQSTGRKTLTIMLAILAGIIGIGLFAIYRSVRTVVDLSERRSRFVSSVTHELKTPLTNIRMYIEMLEQGMARTPERELEYFQILHSECARLSRLITNVLEFSKLEKKPLRLQLEKGLFTEVLAEVQQVMGETMRKEGFTLTIDDRAIQPFVYDREVMIQVMINLLENSMKFGRQAAEKHIHIRFVPDTDFMHIHISDTGPGIPRKALKKIFDDFYRADTSLTQTTQGTGIGLAFVKKFITASGGHVSASNNNGPGCTITLALPLHPQRKE